MRLGRRALDLAGSATFVRAVFDDPHLLIPYAPAVVLRADGAPYGDLPVKIDDSKISGGKGLGASFVGKRPLPFGERSDTIFTLDRAAHLRWRAFELGISARRLSTGGIALRNTTTRPTSAARATRRSCRPALRRWEPRAVYATSTVKVVERLFAGPTAGIVLGIDAPTGGARARRPAR